jgi:hypothetical protein
MHGEGCRSISEIFVFKQSAHNLSRLKTEQKYDFATLFSHLLTTVLSVAVSHIDTNCKNVKILHGDSQVSTTLSVSCLPF